MPGHAKDIANATLIQTSGSVCGGTAMITKCSISSVWVGLETSYLILTHDICLSHSQIENLLRSLMLLQWSFDYDWIPYDQSLVFTFEWKSLEMSIVSALEMCVRSLRYKTSSSPNFFTQIFSEGCDMHELLLLCLLAS